MPPVALISHRRSSQRFRSGTPPRLLTATYQQTPAELVVPTHAPTRPALHSPPLQKRPWRDISKTTVVSPTPASTAAAVPLSRSRRPPHCASPPAINAEFEINPVTNAGVLFAFDEVVRGRRHRHAGRGGMRNVATYVLLASPAKKINALTNTLVYGSGTQLWDCCRPGLRFLDGARRRHPRRHPRSSRPSAIR